MDAANHAPDATHHPGLGNDPFNRLWRDQTLTLNGRCINEPNNMYEGSSIYFWLAFCNKFVTVVIKFII